MKENTLKKIIDKKINQYGIVVWDLLYIISNEGSDSAALSKLSDLYDLFEQL